MFASLSSFTIFHDLQPDRFPCQVNCLLIAFWKLQVLFPLVVIKTLSLFYFLAFRNFTITCLDYHMPGHIKFYYHMS